MWVKTCRVPMHYSDKNAVAHVPYTHACMHTSKYIIMYAQKVSEITIYDKSK